MKIEKLERYVFDADHHPQEGYCNCSMSRHDYGDYVLYSAARDQIDALLEALKECERAWEEGTPIEGTWAETIRQIEETR